ncbi:MAG: septum formation initiator family protein [Rhodoferax sp.]|nr:septum formation initiator family protein [Rhodoferax sp.]
MGSRSVMLCLIALLVILHAQLWSGRGSIPNVAQLTGQLKAQNELNQQAVQANHQLAAEVRDLKEGLEMIEEKARMELGMIKINEIYVQIARSK